MIETPQPSSPHRITPKLLELGDEDLVTKIMEAIKGQDEMGDKSKILCKQCEHVITDPDDITIIQQKFLHTFTNPSGFQFDMQCYRAAPGTLVSGKPTDYFSWFEGYKWQYCYCEKCSNHVGWFYKKEDNEFYGLNLAALKGDI